MPSVLNILSKLIIDRGTDPLKLIEILLANRHVKGLNEFLKPSSPKLDLKLSKAAKIIEQAISKNQNILIYGDYDVDGITATAILWQAIYKKYPNVTPFIPHRQIDGYGVKAKSFFRFQEERKIKFDLLITVDNGIVADTEFIKIKAKQDVKIIITDHHIAPSTNARSCVSTTIHSTKISGSALSWFLAKELDKDADLGLASLGTIADCLPLIGVNRSIVVHGLQQLRLNPNPGIKKLISISGIKQDTLSAHDLGFVLGPRINAVGRLSDPTDALRLLCSQNALQAGRYAMSLNSYNQTRQSLQKESLEIAEKKVNLKNKIIFMSGDFNPGIIGLLAGRLTEKYYLPSVVIAVDNGISKGSCRSVAELNIIETLRSHRELFIDLGGHAAAAGFSIDTKNISKLEKVIVKTVNKKLQAINLRPHLDVDAQMELSAVTLKNINAISKLAPFGIGNPEPLFLFKNLKITSKKIIGTNNDHLKLKFEIYDAIAFKKGELDKTLKIGDIIDVVASVSANTWNGNTVPQLIIKEILV